MLEKVENESTYLEKGLLPPNKYVETKFLEEMVTDSESRGENIQIEPGIFIILESNEAI